MPNTAIENMASAFGGVTSGEAAIAETPHAKIGQLVTDRNFLPMPPVSSVALEEESDEARSSPNLLFGQQCVLLLVPQSSFYYAQHGERAEPRADAADQCAVLAEGLVHHPT